MRIFADDTCIFITVDNRDVSLQRINEDLEAIHRWSDNCLVKFSAPKTKFMVISNKLDRHLNSPV